MIAARLWLVMALALPRLAAAQPASAQAETLFRQGKELMRTGKIADACAAFDSSYRLDAAVTTLLNLADCREKNRQLATAWGLFVDAQRALRDRTDETARQLLATATKRATKLEPRLSTLSIDIAPDRRVPGLAVARRGEAVDAGAWNRALPVDGGVYDLVVRAPGFATFTATVTIEAEGDAKRIEVPALTAAPASTGSSVTSGTSAASTSPPTREAPRHDSKLVPVIALTAGGVAIASGLVVGKLALDRWHDAKDVCGGSMVCDSDPLTARANHLAAQARTRAWWATGLAAGGVAVAGVGLYLVLRKPPRERIAVVPTGLGLAIAGAL